MKTHEMNLQDKYFNFIKNGTKRIELRLYDEKRRKIRSKKGVSPEIIQSSLFTGKVRIDNTKNVLFTLAGCCHPQPGDPIVGYASKNKGIMIHKPTCLTFQRIPNIENRMVEVCWELREKESKKPGQNDNREEKESNGK